MFWHNFVYSLKTLFKSKSLIFWTFVFPILLGTFFKLAFSNIEKNEVLEVFNIAVVNNKEFKKNEFFNEALKRNDGNIDKAWNKTLQIVTKSNDLDLLNCVEQIRKAGVENPRLIENASAKGRYTR